MATLIDEKDKLIDEYNQLKDNIEKCKIDSKVIITRYDRQISKEKIDFYIDELTRLLCESCYYTSYENSFDREQRITKYVANIFTDFVNKYINTTNNESITFSSKLVNFSDVEDTVKFILEGKYKPEFEKKEVDLQLKEKDLEEEIEKYKKKRTTEFSKKGDYINQISGLEKSISDKEYEIKDKDIQIKKLNSQIAQLQNAIEDLKSKNNLLKETVMTQKEQLGR